MSSNETDKLQSEKEKNAGSLLVALLKEKLDKFRKDYNQYRSLSVEERSAITARSSGWLERELRTLLASGNPASKRVVSIIFDDLSGDLTLKGFQLQTLMRLTARYLEDSSFQWFINSTYTSMSEQVVFNPLQHVTSIVDPVVAMSVQSSNLLYRTGLNESEMVVHSTTEFSDAGFAYLVRRPWLSLYIQAIRDYKQVNDLSFIISEVRKFEDKVPGDGLASQSGNPGPDPDSLSTNIPYPEWAVPTLNDIGA